jgi:hypothetical protein
MPRTDDQKKSGRKGQPGTVELRAYRLLAGQHIQADNDWEPPEGAVRRTRSGYFLDEEGTIIKDPETDRPLRCPSKTYNAGEVVLSEIDLVDRFGHQKFEALDESKSVTVRRRLQSHTRGDVTPMNERESASVAPHGQTSTGTPETSTTAEGLTVSGREGAPASEKVAAGLGVAPSEVNSSDAPQAPAGRPGTEAELKAQSEQRGGGGTPHQSGKPRKSASELDRMPTSDLRSLCQEEGVDVPKTATREQMLKALKSSGS